MRSLLSALAAVALAAACSSSSSSSSSGDGGRPSIHASDYDQSCSGDGDCIGVQDGDACCLSCITAAINKNDQAKFDDDASKAHAACGTNVACPAIACDSPGQPACRTGRCTLAPPVVDAGGGDASSE